MSPLSRRETQPVDSFMVTSPPRIFDRPLVARRLAAHRTGAPDFITDLVIADLADRLAPVTRTVTKALIMGPDAQILPETGRTANGPFTYQRQATLLHPGVGSVLDPDYLKLPDTGYDLIVSLMDLQLINDVPGFLTQIRAHLVPDGLFMAAALGGDTLTELRSAWLSADAAHSGGAAARVAPFIDIRDAGALLQRAGFALPVTDLETHTVRYADPLALMNELRTLGASNPLADRPQQPVSRSLLLKAATAYQDQAADPDGRVRATLDILWMTGWAPHESQQKPLKPGSAKQSLADALKAKPV